MNANDHPADSSHHEAEVSTQQAEPYRTPETVPDPASRRGLLGSPIAWLIAGGIVIGGAAFLLAPQKADQGVVDYIEDFGGMRRSPVEEIEAIESYEAEMQAAESPAAAP